MDNTPSHLNMQKRIHNQPIQLDNGYWSSIEEYRNLNEVISSQEYLINGLFCKMFLEPLPTRISKGTELTTQEVDHNTEQAYIDALQPHFRLPLTGFKFMEMSREDFSPIPHIQTPFNKK